VPWLAESPAAETSGSIAAPCPALPASNANYQHKIDSFNSAIVQTLPILLDGLMALLLSGTRRYRRASKLK
jgi:hypothetical protein